MKKITGLIVLGLISISVFLLGFDYRSSHEPNAYYQVYLDEEVIGVIKSKEALEKYIDNRGEFIKSKYDVETVYAPEGLEIRRINTFIKKVDDIDTIYKTIEKKRSFTIGGYQFTVKGDLSTKKIYVTEKEVFDVAINDTIKTFVGEERYENYQNNTQSEIISTGEKIEEAYIGNEITIKQTNIPITETIYNDSKELAKFLLFGSNENQKEYTVKLGDTIQSISFANKISVEEFLISNPTFTNYTNLLSPGQKITIGVTDPQVKVVIKEHVVEDLVDKYKTEYVVDPTLYQGDRKVIQKGQNGTIRVSQNIVTINGNITEVTDKENKKEILSAINEIVKIGDKKLPINVGTDDWAWPTVAGWRFSSPYGYRIHPVTGIRHLHNGIDLSGTGLNSNIYAANSGTVTLVRTHGGYGKTVIINHNNGYYSLYGHLNGYTVEVGQTVTKGQVIGKMGNTGVSTGIHLHFSIFLGDPMKYAPTIDPMRLYR
jgi:murein DD-endopeptidase MepM/ murein hydrolase activator NlpD